MIKKALYIFIMTIIVISYCLEARAISVTPSRAEYFIEPGKQAKQEYTITNTEDKPMKMSIYPEKWSITEGKDATKWVTLSPKSLMIPPKGVKKFTCEVRVPKDATGEYTSSMVMRADSPVQINEAMGAVVQVRVALYVIVKGTQNVQAEILNAAVLKTAPFDLTIKLKNTGNVHIRPKGKIEIMRLRKDGDVVVEEDAKLLKVNPIEGPIFPDAEGEIGPKKDGVNLTVGEYKAKITIELSPGVIMNKELLFNVPEEK